MWRDVLALTEDVEALPEMTQVEALHQRITQLRRGGVAPRRDTLDRAMQEMEACLVALLRSTPMKKLKVPPPSGSPSRPVPSP